MITLIAKAMFFFVFILGVSLAVFATLAVLVGKFFNVTVAQDSVLSTLMTRIPAVAKLWRGKRRP